MQTESLEAEQTKGGGGGVRYIYGYELSQWEDNVAKLTFGTKSNAPISYDPLLEHHHHIMSKLGDPRGWLER